MDLRAGTGDFTGPASSTDNAVVRFNGTGGKTGQDSVVLIGDTGAITGALSLNLSGLTASEILITDGSKNLISAAVATYPSLAELAYVKGATSSIQTQITARQLILAEGAFVDGDKTKLDGVEDGADVTDTTNVTAAGALMDSELTSITDVKALDQSVVSGATPTFTNTNFTEATDMNYVTDAEQTVIGNTSNTNTGDETATTLGATIGGAGDATPNDTDFVATSLTAAGVLKKITWTNVKAFLKTYFDTLYAAVSGFTLTGVMTLGENASIALDPAGSADGKYSGTTITGTGGETIAFGEPVYLKAADTEWYKTDASGVATAGAVLTGICVLASTDGGAITVLMQGQIRADAAFPTFTVGGQVFLSETSGDVTQTAPTTTDAVVQSVGYALTANEMYWNPSPDFITHT